MDSIITIFEEIFNIFTISLNGVGAIEIGDIQLAQIADGISEFEPSSNIKLAALFLSVISIVLIVLLIIKFRKLSMSGRGLLAKSAGYTSTASSSLDARWQEITNHINSIREAEWKFAVIEADKLVDDVLKSAGFKGESMGDRMINMDLSHLRTLNDLWEAHKIRNRVVHDANYFLRHSEAQRVIELYERTLRELQAIN